jgi:hypothetical protein
MANVKEHPSLQENKMRVPASSSDQAVFVSSGYKKADGWF